MHYKTISLSEHYINRSITFTFQRNHPILIHIFILYCILFYMYYLVCSTVHAIWFYDHKVEIMAYLLTHSGQGFQKLEPKRQTDRNTDARDRKHYYAAFAGDKNSTDYTLNSNMCNSIRTKQAFFQVDAAVHCRDLAVTKSRYIEKHQYYVSNQHF